ncbi:DUF4760 domain-containing protein [Pasteurella skyensis]|uniref:DUF4760 domain-containing protein n=1 Tax=Phocoenobacter skyensis TaxID=97481 RepID=A0AAJ6N8X1_9PAST|nr:DUF4760 domain-containing protein [Pasteurella skyensis]MDP8162305.1 DUF4760 domain-containing protein [Pasteurella skyensis]MDP8172361.1 DUF4760 domain-containing protein [Pasteurella skyensis]MDP8177006.1 DUF4760 domain-containing protein [Pasteurella skyensis]MDP8178616.1 DUF4760 domain-containing protein [Pasteurella skyensis]MDP8182618.1 DUF4760 domain-containing protein [Pasteurella skyensis]
MDWTGVIQTIAVCAAAIFTALSIRSNTKNARQRATIDLILHQTQNKELQEAITLVNRLARQGIPLVDHYKIDDVFRGSILKVLNSREFTATGIRENIFDENVYKRSQCTNFTRDWKRLECVVLHIREATQKDTLFQDFEHLGKKWLLNPLKVLK